MPIGPALRSAAKAVKQANLASVQVAAPRLVKPAMKIPQHEAALNLYEASQYQLRTIPPTKKVPVRLVK